MAQDKLTSTSIKTGPLSGSYSVGSTADNESSKSKDVTNVRIAHESWELDQDYHAEP